MTLITDKLIEASLINEGPPRYVLRSAKDALQPQPPMEWIINNLFSAGSISLVVGESGSKKTWILLDMAVCVARGENWIGFSTIQGATLVIDEDNGERKLAGRLHKILSAHGANESTPVHYVSLAGFDLRKIDDANELEMLINLTSARLVIIDTMADIMPGCDENSVKDVLPIFMTLRRIAERTRAAIVLIHHTNKIGGYRGSTALKGAVDLMLMVDSKPDSPNIDFKTEKARDTEPIHFAAVANFMPDEFLLTASRIEDKARSFDKSKRYVLRYLFLNGASGLSAIQANADQCSASTVRDAVYALVKIGLVIRANGGGQGVKAIFDLTGEGIKQAEKL